MKIAIVVTDKKKGEVRIPISKKEAVALYDISFMIDDMWDTIEINKIDKETSRLCKKFQHLLHDVIYDGEMLGWDEDKDKWTPRKKRWYLVKKPKWVKL